MGASAAGSGWASDKDASRNAGATRALLRIVDCGLRIENQRVQSAIHNPQSSCFSLLEYRQIPLGHLEDDQRHRRPVIVAGAAVVPHAAGALRGEQLAADGGPPAAPAIPAGEEHRLHGVVLAV